MMMMTVFQHLQKTALAILQSKKLLQNSHSDFDAGEGLMPSYIMPANMLLPVWQLVSFGTSSLMI